MNRAECERLIADYLRWLKQGLEVSELEGSCRIATPFVDRHNDEIEIYVEKRNGGMHLTDDGYTLADLAASGMTFNTEKRRAHLAAILFITDAEHPPNEGNLAAIRAYHIQPLVWSRRDEALGALNGG
jgi:hypothetical protein